MAFTTENKATIIRLLGWPGNTINPNSLSYNNVITNRLMIVLPEVEEMATGLVDRIETLDGKLEAALDQSGVKRIDDIEFFGPSDGGTRLGELRKERRRLIRELSQLLDIPTMTSTSMGSVCI